MTVFGALVGFGAVVGFYLAVGFVMKQGGFLSDFGVTGSTVILGFAIAGLVGLVSAAVPALRASRMSIAEALRFLG